MTADERPVLNAHGATRLPSVEVDSYNLEIKDSDGFVGDKASRGAFHAMLEKWREPLRKLGADPLGEKSSEQLSKKQLDKLLTEGHPEAGGIIHSAVEEFAQTLASVVKRFLKAASWRDTEAIVIGGGFRGSRVGELAVGRTEVLLKAADHKLELELIRHHPDEAGLIGTAHLAPSWMLEGFDGILAVDIGGTNIRVGIVETKLKKAKDLSKAAVFTSDLWRHGDEKTRRSEAVERLIEMLEEHIALADKEGLKLAPVIGIGCPGRIREDGSIETGAQNLPGNWESSRFNLSDCIREKIPLIEGHETQVVIHNDAVVQGLSELPEMRDYDHWGALTIGTGLGNARFTNRRKTSD
ncbi:MAG: ROK family protein [Hyphomicrobium sp.]|uniref:ROK family protein n=1 Tax=Hyphomicrobium sp. TaxID=82 RepID=UPI001324CF16|nr:ROK family protein [Hyphomicrobium sp.]KAB2943199.1 MAG: ROK family protein [Hyphomicrobium sp.]MBZ0210161.1 ROK family protein [Hyphomicrobium sp.]